MPTKAHLTHKEAKCASLTVGFNCLHAPGRSSSHKPKSSPLARAADMDRIQQGQDAKKECLVTEIVITQGFRIYSHLNI